MPRALPRWARWVAGVVVAVGAISVVAIPFVDAGRMVPSGVRPADTYSYTIEVSDAASLVGTVRVSVVEGVVAAIEVVTCRSGVDCAGGVEPFIPYDALVAEVSGRHWVVRGQVPLIEAVYDDPADDGDERSVRVLDYREG